MYNTDLPTRADLPTSARLWRSTGIAVVVATLLLVTVILPSEYGIDPLRIGRVLGFTQMGEIKMQLADEAALDAASSSSVETAAQAARLDLIDRRLDAIIEMLEQPSSIAQDPDQVAQSAVDGPQQDLDVATIIESEPAPPLPAEPPASAWRDEISITLAPGQGVEYKLVMQANAEAEFSWSANGGVVNFDTHGDGGGNSVSYEQGRSVAEDQGTLRAAFEGNHGWFFRNRTEGEVTLILRTRGNYSELKRTV